MAFKEREALAGRTAGATETEIASAPLRAQSRGIEQTTCVTWYSFPITAFPQLPLLATASTAG